ncbi:Response regulator receiver domain protein [compost metagenome]
MPEDRRNIILVVENNDMMIRFYKTLFDDKYDIIDAKNVRDTIYAYSKSKNIKLIILDYNLGEENFDKILDFVKTNFEESKKIIVTGYHDIDYLKEIYKNDVDDIIPKPIGFSFKQKVIEMIGDSGLENKLFH